MLALVDNQVARIEPALEIQGGFSVTASPERIVVSVGGQPIQSGVIFYNMTGQGLKVNYRTGEYQGKGVIRAVFAGQHVDTEVGR